VLLGYAMRGRTKILAILCSKAICYISGSAGGDFAIALSYTAIAKSKARALSVHSSQMANSSAP